jgi:hypothetical protein
VRLSADKGHRKPFTNQDLAHIPASSLQRSAASAVIAGLSPFCAFRARTGHEHEIEIARTNEIPKPARGLVSELPLSVALRSPRLGRIEADQPHIRLLMVDADCITVELI